MRETLLQELLGGLTGTALVVRVGLWYLKRR